MPSSPHTDREILIIGSGLAGLSLCFWMLETIPAEKITLLHNADPLQASNGPTLLFHPFPGRSLEPEPLLPFAVAHTMTMIKKWQQIAPEQIRSMPIIRPFVGSNGARLHKSYEKHWMQANKSNLWQEYIDKQPTITLPTTETHTETKKTFQPQFRTLSQQDIAHTEPALHTGVDGVVVEPSYAIDGADLIAKLHQYLQGQGISIHIGTATNISHSSTKSVVQYTDTRRHALTMTAKKVVLCLGRHTKEWFPDAHITLQGGSLLRSQVCEITHSISVDGIHIAKHRSGDWVVGATRWDDTQPSKEEEIASIQNKLEKTLSHPPKIHTDSTTVWSGVRCIYPTDRLPLCGAIPQHRNIFILTALGSKGLLWGIWASKVLCDSILDANHNQKTPHLYCFDLQRASTEDAWYSPKITNVSQ